MCTLEHPKLFRKAPPTVLHGFALATSTTQPLPTVATTLTPTALTKIMQKTVSKCMETDTFIFDTSYVTILFAITYPFSPL
jgi:hypothetical protein